MKIVIIDDDRLVSISLKTILEASGDIEVCATGDDGGQAMALYEEHKPDVMLMDIRMRDVNGLDSAEELLKVSNSADMSGDELRKITGEISSRIIEELT